MLALHPLTQEGYGMIFLSDLINLTSNLCLKCARLLSNNEKDVIELFFWRRFCEIDLSLITCYKPLLKMYVQLLLTFLLIAQQINPLFS